MTTDLLRKKAQLQSAHHLYRIYPLQHPLDLDSTPRPTTRCRDAPVGQRGGNLTKRGAAHLQLADGWREISGTLVRLLGADSGTRLGPKRANGGDVAPVTTELLPARFRSRKRVLGALRDRLRFVLGHGGQNVNREPVGLRKIHGHKLHPTFHKIGHEGHVAGQPVEFGDDQRGLVQAAELQRLRKLRAIAALAALDLHDLVHKLPVTAIQIGPYGLLLRLQAQSAAALALRRAAVVGDEFAVVLGHSEPVTD